jgi:serine/threonine protein kinase
VSDDWSRQQGGPGRPGPDVPGNDRDLERTRVLGPNDRATEYLPPAGGRVLAGRYRLDQALGAEAGMEFHQATDQRDGREVAVTVFTGRLDQAGSRRFLDQARSLAAVHHPDLVAVLDVGVERSQGWLVRELVDGWTLRAEVRRGVLPAAEVARAGHRAAAALAEAHDHGLTHRDVSPDTVVLTRDGGTRVAELGVAELSRITGGPGGGPEAYVSPEQVRREPIGPPADVYALGLTLLEALTARVEYPGGGWEAASARLTRPPVVPNDVPTPLARALLAMTATAPGDRPSARESAGLLDQTGSGAPTTYAAVAEPATTSPGRRVAMIALPVLALLVLIGVVVAATNNDDTSAGSTAAGATSTSTPSTGSPARSTRTKTPSKDSSDSNGSGSDSDSGFSLPSFTAPSLPKASDVEKAVTDKVKDQVQRSLTQKAQDAWTSFTDWVSGLF